MGGVGVLRPSRGSPRSRGTRPSITRCSAQREQCPQYLVSHVRQKRNARDEQFRSSRARFFGNFRGPTSHHPTMPRPRPNLTPPRPQAPASEISHVIRLLDTSTTATNVAIPTSGFQYLKDVRGNYVRDCWETMAQRPSTPQPPNTQRGRDRITGHGFTPEISHVIRLLDTSTTATNVAIPTTGFQCLKDVRGNYVRDCWETTTQRPSTPQPPNTQRGRDRKNRPRPRRWMRADQMRKGSFFTRPRPFHQVPSPSVSPALVSGMRIRTSA